MVLSTRQPATTFAWDALVVIAALLLGMTGEAVAQHGDKPRPEAWNNLAPGGRFMDRILPAPVYQGLESDTWGVDAVRPRDSHSSKNIVLPLVVGRRLKILGSDQITADTETIRLRILAEGDFDPDAEVDVESLRFGAPEEVDFGRGCKAVGSEKSGKDLVVTFDAAGHGITEENFAAKLIGKTAGGKLLFGYSPLPGVDYSLYGIKR